MITVHPKVHIICGVCGCRSMFSAYVDSRGICDDDGTERPAAFITCDNCSTLSELGEVIEDNKK